jgi:hypothetical protein
MSGGSFNYLFSQETLLGKHEAIERMVEYIQGVIADKKRTKDYIDGKPVLFTAEDRQDLRSAAVELGKLANWLEHCAIRSAGKQKFYEDLLKAVEWSASCDSGPAEIIEAYKALMEDG